MSDLFLSRINALGHQVSNGGSVSDLLGGRASSTIDLIQDESADNIENLAVTYYDKPDIDPKAAHNFSKFIAGKSLADSVVTFPDGIVRSLLSHGVRAVFSGSPDNARYLVCPYINAEYFNGSSLFKMPLVIRIDEFDKDSSLLKGSLVTGVYDADSDSYSLAYDIENTHLLIYNGSPMRLQTVFFALSDLPDLSAVSDDSRFSAFILKSDCPAIRKDARKGDVFVFGQSLFMEAAVDSSEHEPVLDSWIKLYSLQDKLDLLLNNPEKEFNINVDGRDVVLAPKAFMYDQLFSSHVDYDKEAHSFLTTSTYAGGKTSMYLNIPVGEEVNLYAMEELLVNGVNTDGAEDNPLRLVVKEINQNGQVVVSAANGEPSGSVSDIYCKIPPIPEGSRITVLDNREKISPTIALMLNDLTLTVDNNVRECKRGEVVAIVGDKIVPVEFDAFFRE